MTPSRTSTRIAFALIVFRAIVTFICLMSIAACISAIAHGALFEQQDQGLQGKGGGYGNELKVGYSLPSIGASLVTIGCTMLAMNLGSNPLWRFFSWQTSLMDGFGYATFVVGIIYIILGVGPWELRERRDDNQSP
ncbi:MAG: hypothetical protein J3R72DRAFT_479417 [Linnemannia gamsii]|nr:MAG: hypothetical protein J3R72DRAFT_479417 [Linnemannia gamsii]